MASVFTSEFVQARIDALLEMITAYETAITAVVSTNQSYSLDTSQTRITVTKANLTESKNTLLSLYQQLNSWDLMLNGGTGTYAAPMW